MGNIGKEIYDRLTFKQVEMFGIKWSTLKI